VYAPSDEQSDYNDIGKLFLEFALTNLEMLSRRQHIIEQRDPLL
jgi:hypothetical protein